MTIGKSALSAPSVKGPDHGRTSSSATASAPPPNPDVPQTLPSKNGLNRSDSARSSSKDLAASGAGAAASASLQPDLASAKPTVDVQDSQMIAELDSSLKSTQSTIAELRQQLSAFNSTVASSQAQLQLSVDELRRKKKEEDADRQELKQKMKQLEENKRQAEAARREAEKKLKTVENQRDAIRQRIDKMQNEIEGMKADMEQCNDSIEQSRLATEQHTAETENSIKAKELELEELDRGLMVEVSTNAELATKVVQAAETLQSLIDNSPQQSHPVQSSAGENTGNQVGIVPGRNHQAPVFTLGDNSFQPSSHFFPLSSGPVEEFVPSQARQFHPGNTFNPGRGAHNVSLPSSERYGHQASLNGSQPESYGRSSPFQPNHSRHHNNYGSGSLTNFGPPTVPFESEEPGSPSVLMSSSFSADNLLPQGLFKSLEGDQTPLVGSQSELDDSLDLMEHLDPATYELPRSPDKPESSLSLNEPSNRVPESTSFTPRAISPDASANRQSLGQERGVDSQHGQNGLSGGVEVNSSHQANLDEASRMLSQYTGQDEDVTTKSRRWFSGSKIGAGRAGDVTNSAADARNGSDIYGNPLAQTVSNDSLLVPGGGFDNNPFAPSAAEKRALRWGTLGKWAGVGGTAGTARQASDGSTSHAHDMDHHHRPYGPSAHGHAHFPSPPSSARASSVDLNNQQARSAWDQAGAHDSGVTAGSSGSPRNVPSMINGAVPQEKRSFRLWSLGKKSAKEEPGSGTSIWN